MCIMGSHSLTLGIQVFSNALVQLVSSVSVKNIHILNHYSLEPICLCVYMHTWSMERNTGMTKLEFKTY